MTLPRDRNDREYRKFIKRGDVDSTIAVVSQNPFISQVYEDSGNTYVCSAVAGTALTDSLWKISRFDVDGNARLCDGDDNFDNVATDAATVAALSYS